MFDFHPESANLFVAAGGSGHAFSALPSRSHPFPCAVAPPRLASRPHLLAALTPLSLSPSLVDKEFLPLVGPWILGALQRTLPAEQLRLWSFTGDRSRLDKSRGEGPVVRRDLDSGKVVEVRSAPGVEVRAKL